MLNKIFEKQNEHARKKYDLKKKKSIGETDEHSYSSKELGATNKSNEDSNEHQQVQSRVKLQNFQDSHAER